MVRQIDISTTDPNSPELLLQHWQKAFINILDTVAPIRTFPMHRHRSPCLNAEIRELIRHRDFLAKQFKKNPGSSTLKEDLKLAQRRMKSRIRREAKEQATQALNSSNPVDAWNYIKRATFTAKGGEDSLPPLDTLNQYFATVVQTPQNTQLVVPPSCNNDDTFCFSELTSGEVQKALYLIKFTTAPGHDKFPGFVLKRLAGALSPNITTIYNSSTQNNIVPSCWKMAEVRAIYKQKGSKTVPNNYRPISVIPILGRTLEKLIATQLPVYNYCDEHNILPPEQFGFRRHSSCEMALFAATDSWMKSVDKGSYAGALLVDLSKAFDTVPHQLLLSELRDIGCSTEVLNWFCNYLTDRLQRVITHEDITDWIMVPRGFPQGSGLSPLLFNIFARNLPRQCTSSVFQFADDTTLTTEDPSPSVCQWSMMT